MTTLRTILTQLAIEQQQIAGSFWKGQMTGEELKSALLNAVDTAERRIEENEEELRTEAMIY